MLDTWLYIGVFFLVAPLIPAVAILVPRLIAPRKPNPIKLDTYEELVGAKYTAAIIVAIEEGKERALVTKMRENNKQLKDKSVDEVKNHLANEVLTVFGDSFDVENDPTNQHHGKAVSIAGEDQVTMHQLRTFSRFSPYSLSEFGAEAPPPVEMTPGKAKG